MPYWPHDAALTEKPYTPGARERYLADCSHWPTCEDPWLCSLRRRLDDGVRAGVITQGQASGLVKKFLLYGRS